MHFARSWIFAVVAVIAFLFAPSARADGLYVTITNSAGTSTPRTTGAVFSAAMASDATTDQVGEIKGGTTYESVNHPGTAHLEIDSILGSAGSIAAVVTGPITVGNAKPSTMKVEYTAPDSTGQEQVYLVATFETVALTTWTTTYAAGSTETQSMDFVFLKETLAPPPASKGARALPKVAPEVRRTLIKRAPAAAHIDDAYFSFQGFAGESTAAGHSGQTRATSVAISSTWPIALLKQGGSKVVGFNIGLPTATAKITKAMGTSTASFLAAQSQGTNKQFNGSLQFVQHAGASDVVRFTVDVQNVWVQSDATQASSSGQIETISLMITKNVSMTDATTGATGRLR